MGVAQSAWQLENTRREYEEALRRAVALKELEVRRGIALQQHPTLQEPGDDGLPVVGSVQDGAAEIAAESDEAARGGEAAAAQRRGGRRRRWARPWTWARR